MSTDRPMCVATVAPVAEGVEAAIAAARAHGANESAVEALAATLSRRGGKLRVRLIVDRADGKELSKAEVKALAALVRAKTPAVLRAARHPDAVSRKAAQIATAARHRGKPAKKGAKGGAKRGAATTKRKAARRG